MPNDKPAIVAEEAQKAAAVAKEAADIAAGLPGIPHRAVVLHVIAGVGVAAGAVVAISTLGVVPGILASAGAVTAYIIGWLNPSPQAVSAFGASAK